MYDPNFCIDSNIPSCFNILVSELELISVPVIEYEEDQTKIMVYLLNVAWSLVCNKKRQALRINEQNEIILNQKARINVLEDSNNKTILLLENEKKQCSFFSESLGKIKSENDKLTLEIREMKKQVNSLQGQLSKQELQFEHDIRRQNCLIEQLKIKLFKLLGPSSHKIPEKSITGVQSIVPIKDKKLTNKCISNLQNNIQLLLMENVNLRNSLLRIHTASSKKKTKDDDLISKETERLVKLPYQELISGIEDDIIALIS
ncbi:afadin- and alpha-actinin-binding protein-like [Halyomorpha halys]|uniref:afadin- and alpha-actinin-binding protein-like n=1 Tax=Halyomorpha halys TaxID=286706 RepID=UPI0034D27168